MGEPLDERGVVAEEFVGAGTEATWVRHAPIVAEPIASTRL